MEKKVKKGVERKAKRKLEENLERVRIVGFEVSSLVTKPDELCERGVFRLVGKDLKNEKCGKTVFAAFSFKSKDNPNGVRAALCRRCIGKLARDLVELLECDG